MKKYIFLLLLGATYTLNAQEIVLNIPIATQEQSNWCAAAASQSVLRYLPPNNIIKQCVIMEWVRQEMGSNNCCDVPGNCDEGFFLYGSSRSVQSVLSFFGGINSNPYSSNYPPLAEIYTCLSNNRPLIISVWVLHYDLHAVVVRGMYIYPGLDQIYYMNPSSDPIYGGNQQVSYLNLISGFNSPYTWIETLIACSSSKDKPCNTQPNPEDLCTNRIRDANEEGVDCGGPNCPRCTPCNNCKLDEGEDMIDCGGSCPPCMHFGNLADEITITNTSQLTSEVKAYKKIAAGSATTVASGQKITFTTNKTGSIVLLPGFKAEEGSNLSAQMQDYSAYSRFCGAICGGHSLSKTHTAPLEVLQINNLLNAVRISYSIYKRSGGASICDKSLDISSNGDFALWNCYEGTVNPTNTVEYMIVYSIEYCNNTGVYQLSHNFSVYYSYYKSLPDDPASPPLFSPPPSNDTPLHSATATSNLTIIPNPNPGTFQLETNFPLTNIGNLKITNLLGATVYETQKVTSNTIQLQNPSSGTFFVVMILKDGAVLTRKMVVQ